jgi:hypothetical protein
MMHPAFYSVGTEAVSSGIKRPRREADHLFPSGSECRMCGVLPLVPHTNSCCAEGKFYEDTANYTVTRICLNSAYYQTGLSFTAII